MVARKKIDSNETSAYYAEEYDLAQLPGENGAPGAAVWYPIAPNSYDDFGGELSLLARNPINRSRQRKKGAIVDIDANAGYNEDFTASMQHLMQGVMFADFRNKAEGAPSSVTATGYALASTAGFAASRLVYASGFENPANNGLKLVSAVTSGEVQTTGLVVETVGIGQQVKLVTVGMEFASGDLSIVAGGSWPEIRSAAVDLTTLGLIPGEWLFVGGDDSATSFATAGNNGFARVRSVSAGAIVVDLSATSLVSDAGTGKTIRLFFGRVLKNELGSLIKRRSYHIERQLGAPDTGAPDDVQSEYVKGAVPSEFVLNYATADKINADISFLALDNEQRTAADGLKTGTRVPFIEYDAFNTSSDVSIARLALVTPGNTAPTALFGYLTEFTLTINNNLSVNKAIGVVGGFDITAGTFQVSAETMAYFADVEAVRAVRRNSDVCMFLAHAKLNTGFIFDVPLIALSNARLDVSQDEPIMLPLTIDAATAAKINPNTDYTLMWVFFDYLPTRAE